MKKVALAVILLFVASAALAAGANRYAAPKPDPWANQINDVTFGPAVQFSCGTPRNQTINPANKTLVLITAGQSQWQDISPTLFTPTNFSAVDGFNVYDGGSYSVSGPLCGTQLGTASPQGPGNVAARVADTFVTNGVFNRVVVAPVAIGGTTIANWSTATLYNRVCQVISRLASRGMTPSTTGVAFAFLWGQGESDTVLATSQSAYTSSFSSMFTALQACGLTGFRSFVIEETWDAGSVSTAVQNAQIALVNNTTIFSGGNLDTLNATFRNPDNVHFNDAGAAAAASIVYTAMHASGSPF